MKNFIGRIFNKLSGLFNPQPINENDDKIQDHLSSPSEPKADSEPRGLSTLPETREKVELVVTGKKAKQEKVIGYKYYYTDEVNLSKLSMWIANYKEYIHLKDVLFNMLEKYDDGDGDPYVLISNIRLSIRYGILDFTDGLTMSSNELIQNPNLAIEIINAMKIELKTGKINAIDILCNKNKIDPEVLKHSSCYEDNEEWKLRQDLSKMYMVLFDGITTKVHKIREMLDEHFNIYDSEQMTIQGIEVAVKKKDVKYTSETIKSSDYVEIYQAINDIVDSLIHGLANCSFFDDIRTKQIEEA